MPWYRSASNKADNNSFVIFIHSKPKASRSQIIGISDCGNFLEVAIASPPCDGKANAALIELFAERLKIAKSYCNILRGQQSRYKQLSVNNISEEQLKNLL